MKKTVRTYTKRTVAVFMAALMLLTAWVFVAPQKASAVTGGKYTYRVVFETTYARNADGNVTVTWREKNGTGSSANDKTTSASFGSGTSNSEGTHYLITGESGSTYDYAGYYPVGFSVYHKINTYAGFSSNFKFKAYVQIKNTSGTWVSICSTAEHTGKKSKNDSETWSNNPTTKPYANSMTWDTQPNDIYLKEYGATDTYSDTDQKTTTAQYHAYDQFGILMGSDYTVDAIKYSVGDSSSPSSTDSTYLTASQTATAAAKNTTTIYAKSGFRKNLTSNYYATAQLTIKVAGSTAKTFTSNTFKIYNPKFTYTYDKNNGTNPPSEGSLTPTSYKFYYGRSVTQQKALDNKSSTAALYPQNPTAAQIAQGAAITQKRAGYEFQGMYLASYIQYGQTFSAPSGAVKLTDSTTVFPTVNTSSSNDATTNANQTWYAAWLAKNVHVTYLNNDGSVIAQKNITYQNRTGKYNQKATYLSTSQKPATDPTYVVGPSGTGTFDYRFAGWEVVSAKQYSLKPDGTQEQVDYSDIVGQDYENAVLRGDTVFRARYVIDNMHPYTITYKNGSSTESKYNTPISYHYKDEAKIGTADYATATYPASDAESKTYTYEFLGWAQQVNANDTVYYQDWNSSANNGQGAYEPEDPAQTPLSDTKVYHNATWVAVYGRKYIDYKVTFNYVGVTTDETGATTYKAGNQEVITKHYDEAISIPQPQGYTGGKLDPTSPAPAGVSYSNSTGYTYAFNAWNPALTGTLVSVADLSANGWTASNANLKTRTFTATYSSTAAVYTIKFVGPDTVFHDNGKQHAQYDDETGALLTKVLNPTTSFSHGTSVSSAKNAAEAAVVRTWRDEDNEYTFTGWAPTYASTATDNVTYTAQYTSVPLYTVTYAGESGELGTWKGTAAENIPLAPTNIDDEVLFADPTKEGDLYAPEYTFNGWAGTPYNAKNPVTPQITETRNMTVQQLIDATEEGDPLTVYAQFSRTPTIYKINFKYGNPVLDPETNKMVLPDHWQNLEYGEDVTIPTGDTLNRDPDEKYSYEFSMWDVSPETTVNERIAFETDENGENPTATYTATYRKSYVYYDVTWLYQNGEKVEDETDHIYKDFRVEKYIYGERIRAPFSTPAIRTTDRTQDPLLPELGENCTYAFDQWVLAKKVNGEWVAQRDENDNLIPFNNSTYVEVGVEYAYLPTYKSVADVRTLIMLDEDGETELGRKPDVGYDDLILAGVDEPEAKNPDATYHYAFDEWVYVADDSNTYTAGDPVADTDTMKGNITIKATFTPEAHTYKDFETETVPTFDAAGVETIVCEADGCGHTETVDLPALSDTVRPAVRLYVKNTYWDSVNPPALTALDDTVIPIAPNSLLIANTTDTAEVSAYYINKATKDVKTALAEGTDDPNDYIEVICNPNGVGSRVNEIWAYYSNVTAGLTLLDLADVPNATEANPDGWHQIYARTGDEEANHSDVFASFEPAIVDGQQYIVYLKAIDAKGNENYTSSQKLGYDTTPPAVTLESDYSNEAGTKFCLETKIVLEEDGLTVLLDGNEITMTKVTDDPETEEVEPTTYEYEVTAVGKHTVRVTDPAGNVVLKAFQIIGHHQTSETYQAATCTVDGWKKDICDLCGEAILDYDSYPDNGYEILKASGHNYQPKTKAATCTEAGYTQEICSKCGDKKDPVPIQALDHDWNDGTITKQPNCTQNGIMVYKCKRCNVKDIIEGDALDVTAADYDPDAAAAILTAHPDLAVTEDVPVIDPETNEPVLDPETEEPLTETKPVQAIDAFGNLAYIQKTDPETGAPLFTETEAKDAEGNTIYNSDGTKAYLPDYTDTPIYKYTIVHDYNNHNFKADKQTKAPFCEVQGEITHECRFCGLKFHVNFVDALGHNWTADEADEAAWAFDPAPTCTEAGWKYPIICARCGDANTDKEGKIKVPALGHDYNEDSAKSVAPAKDEHDQWIMHDEFIGEYYIDNNGNMIDDEHKDGAEKTVYGYKYYVCDNDPHHIKVEEWNPEVTYTYTFKNGDEVIGTITKHPGEQIREEDLPVATKADTFSARYIFDKWLYAGTTDKATFPMIISQDTGNKTFVASFREETIYYTITFYEEDGTTGYTVRGFKTYEQEFVEPGPERAPDDTYVYTFKGWIPKDADPATATPITTIKVLGDAEYKAVYEKTTRTYTVTWEVKGTVKKTETGVPAGSILGVTEGTHDLTYPANPENYYDDSNHYTFTGWNVASGTEVTGNTRIQAQFIGVAHECEKSEAESTPPSCTMAGTNVFKCKFCDYSYTRPGASALGHHWEELSRTDTTITYKCTRDGCNETQTKQRTDNLVKLTITVKDTNGNPVSGVKVYVYDGDELVASGTTGNDGKVTVKVPGNKTYRIEIEGKSGTITVDGEGNIVSGNVPVVSRGGGGGCDCTCHKSGFWPMIFRFFHKIIKMITGEFRCCKDADY